MLRNKEKGNFFCKVYMNKSKGIFFFRINTNRKKGSILIECMVLLLVLTIVMGIISYISLSRIRDENNLWVSDGFVGYKRNYEKQIGEVYKYLANQDNLDEKLKGDFKIRKDLIGPYIARYDSLNKRFRLLDSRGYEIGVDFTFELKDGCTCKLSDCQVVSKGKIINFIFKKE